MSRKSGPRVLCSVKQRQETSVTCICSQRSHAGSWPSEECFLLCLHLRTPPSFARIQKLHTRKTMPNLPLKSQTLHTTCSLGTAVFINLKATPVGTPSTLNKSANTTKKATPCTSCPYNNFFTTMVLPRVCTCSPFWCGFCVGD